MIQLLNNGLDHRAQLIVHSSITLLNMTKEISFCPSYNHKVHIKSWTVALHFAIQQARVWRLFLCGLPSQPSA